MATPERDPGVPAYLVPYRDALAHHGPSFAATLWKSRRAQRARFRALTRMIDLRHHIVVDAGCGLGDLAEYLAEKRITPRAYIGVDAFPDLIDRAAARRMPYATFLLADFARNPAEFSRLLRDAAADVVVFSGSLNTMTQAQAIAVVSDAFDAARFGVVFNFLSASSPKARTDPDDPAQRFDPGAVVEWALTRTPLVHMRSDYLRGHDATVAMRHNTAPIR